MLLVTIICFSNVRADEPILPEIGPEKVLTQKDMAAITEDANNANEAIAEFIRVNAGVSQKVLFLKESASMDGDTIARVKFIFETTSEVGGTNTFAIDKRFFSPRVQFEVGESIGALYASEGHDIGVNWYEEKEFHSPSSATKAILKTLMNPNMTSGFCFKGTARSMDGVSAVFTHPGKSDALVVPLTFFRDLPAKGQPLEFIVETLSNEPLVSWKYQGFPTRNDDFDEMRITAENAVATIESNLP